MIGKYLTNNDCYKVHAPLYVKGITVHSTGVNNPNVSRYVDAWPSSSVLNWNRPNLTKCVHAFLGKFPDGKIDYVQTLPWNIRGWHAGQGSKGSANDFTIGFEICEDGLMDETYFLAAMKCAQELCADLCLKFNLTVDTIKSHHERHLDGYASNHADIDHWLKIWNRDMNWFRACVKELLEGGEDMDLEQLNAERGKLEPSKWATTARVIDRVTQENVSDGSRPRAYAEREEVMLMILNAMETLRKEMQK